MDPLRTGGESLWIHGACFGNHLSTALIFCDVTVVNFKNITVLWNYTILLQISANWERLYELFLLFYIKHKTLNSQETLWKHVCTCCAWAQIFLQLFVKCALCAVQPTDSEFVLVISEASQVRIKCDFVFTLECTIYVVWYMYSSRFILRELL